MRPDFDFDLGLEDFDLGLEDSDPDFDLGLRRR
jgi:hypothetical protein